MAAVTPQPPVEDLVLAVNSGSSSLKFGLFVFRNGQETAVFKGGADSIGKPEGRLQITDGDGKTLLDESRTVLGQAHALEEILKTLAKFGSSQPVAVGHRVVHGGPHLREHQLITDDLMVALEGAVHFAPLHIPPAVELMKETGRLLPQARQYACFD